MHTTILDGPAPVVTPSFPRLDALSVRIPIDSKDWTIWPGPPATMREFVIGFPLELRPFAWDYVRLSSNGLRLEVQPHYRESTFDTFRVDTRGHVTCHALAGLFPFTLGRQPELLEGLGVTLQAVPPLVARRDERAARTIGEIAERLAATALELREIPEKELQHEIEEARGRARETMRGRRAEAFWLAKLARHQRRRGLVVGS